jgi:hypothetical protein
MFEVEKMSKCRLADVVVLSQKNRLPDQNPGAKLSIEIAIGTADLAEFDGMLKAFLFTPAVAQTKQATLDGVPLPEQFDLTSIGAKVGTLRWNTELAGYRLEVELGLGRTASNLVIADCALDSFRMKPVEGGTVLLKFNCESSDVSAVQFGQLAGLKSREITIRLTSPEAAQQAFEAEARPPPRGKLKAVTPDPTSAFVEAQTGTPQ